MDGERQIDMDGWRERERNR